MTPVAGPLAVMEPSGISRDSRTLLPAFCLCQFILLLLNSVYCLGMGLFMSFIFTWQRRSFNLVCNLEQVVLFHSQQFSNQNGGLFVTKYLVIVISAIHTVGIS